MTTDPAHVVGIIYAGNARPRVTRAGAWASVTAYAEPKYDPGCSCGWKGRGGTRKTAALEAYGHFLDHRKNTPRPAMRPPTEGHPRPSKGLETPPRRRPGLV